MARALDPNAPSGRIVYGVVSAMHLWGGQGTESVVPEDTDFCVYSRGTVEPLHCSSAEAAARLSEAPVVGAETAVRGTSDVFLAFEYAAPSWSVRVSRPLATFNAPIEFRRSVLLTLALGVWLVVFASNVLLRHRLDPVAKLQAATRRLAAGDFDAGVTLSTRDELEDLAAAFNTMASGLRDQFTLLAALHEVDREALLGQADIEVARSALLQFPRLLRVEEAVVAVRVLGGDAPDTSVVWRVGSSGRVEQQHLSLPQSGFAELERGPDHWQIAPDAPRPALLRALEPTLERAHLILPLTDRGHCFAAVILVAAGPAGFLEPDVRRVRHVADQVALALANSRLMQRLNALSWGTLEALARSIDAVSPWTAGHSERVTRVSVAIGRQLGLTPELMDQLHRGGLLHDVGKIGVPSAILDKPGKLDDAEFQAIRAHPVIGARILEPIHAYEDVIPIVRHHHERFDGTGYPDRLSGRAIPYLARVLSVGDVYDALVSRRPYREGWTHEAAVDYITSRAAVEFDPDVVAAFLELVRGPAWAAKIDEPLNASGPTLAAIG
jgi:putative nucleotidyltransferase with HDIG domain